MGFPETRARLQSVVFARLGEAASWTAIVEPVQVRLTQFDDLASMGGTQLIVDTMAIKVRKVDVPDPVVGDQCQIVGTNRLFRVTSDPMLDKNAVWTCPVVEVF